MLKANRRSALKLLGGAALTAGAVPSLVSPAAAQPLDLYVAKKYQNIKRGTIHDVNPASHTFTIIWEDLGRFKLKASDLVVNEGSSGRGHAYNQLKPGQVCDVMWYDYVDFLVGPATPANLAQANAMVAQGARIEGVGGSQPLIKLWQMSGMVTRLDPANSQIYMIYKAGGQPDNPAAHAGEVIQLPRIVTDAGKAAMAALKPGDSAVCVFSQQTAINVRIIR